MSITEKCGDRSSIKFICTDTKKLMALFAEKLGARNMQSLQWSVGTHCITITYTYRSMKNVRYRSYVRWKNTGIPSSEF
eukprot:12766418-Ditylum_brightwellii.AAC.1